MTSRECAALAPALERATGRRWFVVASSSGRLLLDGGFWDGRYTWVECWTQDAYRSVPHTIRRVALRDRFVVLSGERRDIEAGHGWPDRAAAAVVEMLGERA